MHRIQGGKAMKRIMFSLIMTLILVCLMSGVGLTATWYVDGDTSTSGNGTSWEEAVKTIQEAIDVSNEGDEIWVGQGTYFLLSQINVNTAVHIYAGFAGWETERDERDWAANVTTVDGQYAVRCFYVTADATIDGLSITQGREEGGGSGGGICTWDSAPTIANCTISHNTAIYPGGGISCHGSASATIINCVISNNLAWDGGGIYNDGSSPTITNCTISNNLAQNGGGIYNDSSSPTITNCILWGDDADEGQEKEIYDDEFSSPTVTYCDIEGGYTGDGNMDSDPLFRDSGNGDFHLHNGSPCIDSGNNEVPDLPVTDFEGDSRVADGDDDGTATVDMGADEVVPRARFSADPTTGTAPVTVQFTDESTGPITSWSWDFGDGETSPDQNPSYTYTSAGDFTVSLTVTGPGGSVTKTKMDYIHVTESSGAPIIDKIRGTKEPGKIIRIIGSGFGEPQGDSEVHIGPKVYGPGHRKIKLWTDTKIKVRLPNYKCEWFKGNDYRRRKIWVVKASPEDERVPSNVKRIKVFKPDTCP
jgi:PKD repeat protein